MLANVGITQINKEISEETGLGETQVKKVTSSFLEIIRQKLIQDVSTNFKGFFTLKRPRKISKEISKRCVAHNKSVENYKEANKGKKKLEAFGKSTVFRRIISDTKHCSGCQAQKAKIAKSAELLNRVNLKLSKQF